MFYPPHCAFANIHLHMVEQMCGFNVVDLRLQRAAYPDVESCRLSNTSGVITRVRCIQVCIVLALLMLSSLFTLAYRPQSTPAHFT